MDILSCMGVVLKSLNHSEQSLVSMKSLPGKKTYMHEYRAFAWNSVKPLGFAFLLLIPFLDVGLSTFFSKQ